MILTIRPAQAHEAEYIGANLRWEDAREVETITQAPAVNGVVSSFEASAGDCYTIRLEHSGKIDKDPAVIFGVAPDEDGHGIVWLLATDAIKHAPLSILREAGAWLDHWCEKYGGLHNLVDARNDLHLRWLRYTGFTFGETHTVNGQPFHHVTRYAPSCVQQHQSS